MLPLESGISGLGPSHVQKLTSHCQGRVAPGSGSASLCANQGAAGLPPSFPGHSPFLMASVRPQRPKPSSSLYLPLSAPLRFIACRQSSSSAAAFALDLEKRKGGGRIGGSRLVGRGRGEAERGGL